MWLLQYNLDGKYGQSKWQTYEGAIANRERLLKATRKAMHKPIGWTGIRRVRDGERT